MAMAMSAASPPYLSRTSARPRRKYVRRSTTAQNPRARRIIPLQRSEGGRGAPSGIAAGSQPAAHLSGVGLVLSAEPPAQVTLLARNHQDLDEDQHWNEQHDRPPRVEQQAKRHGQQRHSNVHRIPREPVRP